MDPTPGFEFPMDARDKVEATLRTLAQGQQPVRSVRPDRQPQPRLNNGQPMAAPQIEVEDAPATVASTIMRSPHAASQLENHVPNVGVSPTPMEGAEYISIDLPSKFAYYPFKDLYIKPFRVPHLAKMAKIEETASMQILAETVSSVLTTPEGHKNIAFMLSMADFNAVMFWLRLNSFSKKSMKITSQCQNPDHINMVNKGLRVEVEVDGKMVEQFRKSPAKSLEVQTIFTQADMEVRYLEQLPDPEYYHATIEGQRLNFRPERVQDAIEFLDSPNWEDEEFQYTARIAAVLDLEGLLGRRLTLDEKVQFVNEALENDDAVKALEFNDLTSNYGIVETVKTTCGECGASGQVLLTIDARSFLSPSFGS